MTVLRTLPLAMLLAAAFAALPGLANHPQPTNAEDGTRVTFDHRDGNEWWVEVIVEPGVTQVLARREGGPWHYLTAYAGPYWAASFHIPPGERVQFQAARWGHDEFVVTSCYFTHPAGQEQCDPGSTDPARFTFRNVKGNEWWQEVYVDATRAPVDAVTVGIYGLGGPTFYPIEKKWWGAYAGSHHAPSGTIVQFEAQSGAESARSACYRWPQATVVECPAVTGRPAFDHKFGKEWWVEVLVGKEPVRVLAQDTNGPWVELTKRSWGAWAASFHIEPGHEVRFRTLQHGSWYESCWFTHPGGRTPDGGTVCEGTPV